MEPPLSDDLAQKLVRDILFRHKVHLNDAQYAQLKEFVDVNEYGLAVETLIDLVENKLSEGDLLELCELAGDFGLSVNLAVVPSKEIDISYFLDLAKNDDSNLSIFLKECSENNLSDLTIIKVLRKARNLSLEDAYKIVVN